MTEELENIYASLLEALLEHDGGRAYTLMEGLSRAELDAVFEKALREQEARETLRRMAIRRMMPLMP